MPYRRITDGQESMRELISDLEELRLAIRMPICLFADGKPVDAEQVMLDHVSTLPLVRGHALVPQHVKSPFSERFIYLELDLCWSLLIGPFIYPNDDASVLMMIRRGLYDIAELERISDYYQALPRIDYRSAVAIGRVTAERYAFKRVRGEHPYAAVAGAFVPVPPEITAGMSTMLPEHYYKTQIHERSKHFAHPSILIEDELAQNIEAGNRDAALAVLRRINRLERATLADQPLRSLKNSLIGSITIFTRAAIQGGVPDRTGFTLSDAFIRQIERASGREQLEGVEEQAIRAFVDLVADENRQRYSNAVLRVIRFIDLHLTEDLRLERLADEVHLHPNYLSSRFRSETGQRVSAYIRDKRLEEAAHMIRYTNNSLKQIAAFLCFSSQSHFSRAFKARYGVTPSDLAGHRLPGNAKNRI